MELAGKARGCSFLAPHLRKSSAIPSPPASSAVKRGLTLESPGSCLPELESHISFLFGFFLNTCDIFYPPCGKLLLFFLFRWYFWGLSQGGGGRVAGLMSDILISSIYLLFSCAVWALCLLINSCLFGFFSLSFTSIHFLLAENGCWNPFRENTHSRVFSPKLVSKLRHIPIVLRRILLCLYKAFFLSMIFPSQVDNKYPLCK